MVGAIFMKALQLSLIEIDERIEPLQNRDDFNEEDVPRMAMGDMAHLMTYDVGRDRFIGEEGIAEKRERALFLVGIDRSVAIHLSFRRTDDEGHQPHQFDEEEHRHHCDTQ